MKTIAAFLWMLAVAALAEDSERVSLLKDAAYVAKTQSIKQHDVEVYVIRHDPKWLLVVEATMQRADATIAKTDVAVQLFDSKGQSLPLEWSMPDPTDYIRAMDDKRGVLLAAGNYLAPRKEGQKLTRVAIRIFGEDCVFPLKKVQR